MNPHSVLNKTCVRSIALCILKVEHQVSHNNNNSKWRQLKKENHSLIFQYESYHSPQNIADRTNSKWLFQDTVPLRRLSLTLVFFFILVFSSPYTGEEEGGQMLNIYCSFTCHSSSFIWQKVEELSLCLHLTDIFFHFQSWTLIFHKRKEYRIT